MKDGQRITFHGEGDQEPGLEPGDVFIVLDQKEHPVFQRQEDNLVMKMDIKLVEALCGFKKTIHTLDDRMLIITSLAGKLRTPYQGGKNWFEKAMPIEAHLHPVSTMAPVFQCQGPALFY